MHQAEQIPIQSIDLRILRSPRASLARQWWFIWPLVLRLAAWLFFAQAYEIAVFQDASWQMVSGNGVYARFALWLASAGDGYYAAPPFYAYMLWVSGRIAAALGGHWWVHQLLIKSWLLIADLAVMVFLLRRSPPVARRYWTLWFVPVVAIGQVQPDLWVGLCILISLALAAREQWTGAGLLLGLGANIKPVPLLIVPFLAIYLIRGRRSHAVGPVCLGVLAAIAIGWLPYVLLFPDAGHVTDVIRFHAMRPIGGLTIPSGILSIANAALTAAALLGVKAGWAEAAYSRAVGAGVLWPVLTIGIFAALFYGAALRRRWSLPQTFGLPVLAFLLANKVVHEHYVLLALPLLVALGLDLRGITLAFSAYLLAAGSPLRFFPSQLGLPQTIESVLSPFAGIITALVLAAIAGVAALLFGLQILAVMKSLMSRDSLWPTRFDTP